MTVAVIFVAVVAAHVLLVALGVRAHRRKYGRRLLKLVK